MYGNKRAYNVHTTRMCSCEVSLVAIAHLFSIGFIYFISKVESPNYNTLFEIDASANSANIWQRVQIRVNPNETNSPNAFAFYGPYCSRACIVYVRHNFGLPIR